MANLCTNIFYCSTDNASNLEIITRFMNETFDWEYHMGSETDIEGEFYSKWTFPQKAFDEMMKTLQPDDSLYIRVLSYEFGLEYAEYRIFKNCNWHIHF